MLVVDKTLIHLNEDQHALDSAAQAESVVSRSDVRDTDLRLDLSCRVTASAHGIRHHTQGGEARMTQSGYQIRHELLCEARLILFDAWSQKCENIRRNADLSKTRSDLPAAPTVADVKAVAEQLYAFVERR